VQRGGATVAAIAADAQRRRRCRPCPRRAAPPPRRASADGGGGSADGDASSRSSSSSGPVAATSGVDPQQPPAPQPKKKKRQADSTDAVASFLTRRFGVAGGLAWLGVLTFGVVSEQLKTRQEQAAEAEGTRDAGAAAQRETPLEGLGAAYRELKVGGGARPARGDLVVLEFSARYSLDGGGGGGEGASYVEPPFADTRATGKPVVLVWGARPLARVLAPAVEAAIADGMRAGGRRVVTVARGGAGGFGASPPQGLGVPQGGVALRYDVTLSRVSVAPS